MKHLNYTIKKYVVTFFGKQSRSIEILTESKGNLECVAEEWVDEYQLQPWA